VCIEYLEVGGGTPIVYFHGAGGVFRNAMFMPTLGERYRLLAPSRPGFDGSLGVSASARDDASVMAEFIHAATGGSVHVIAESAGAASGCWLSIQEPELVESLILVAPTAFGDAPHASRPGSAESLELRLFGADPAWSDPPTDADRAARRRNAQANAASVSSASGNADLLERLGEIAAPTLVLWGTADEILSPDAGQIYVQRIPDSYRVLIYGAAHSLPVAACHQFVALATDFIERGERFVVARTR
jgi:pimeloyl-ACP methyl ester carboxylesterase